MVAPDVSECSKKPQNVSWHTQLRFYSPNSHPCSLTHVVFSLLGRLVCLLMPEKVITFICSP